MTSFWQARIDDGSPPPTCGNVHAPLTGKAVICRLSGICADRSAASNSFRAPSTRFYFVTKEQDASMGLLHRTTMSSPLA